MERHTQFALGEFYHVYNRGIDKRKIFYSSGDWSHFQRLMWARNTKKEYIRSDRLKSFDLRIFNPKETLVDICAYVLMDNHFHFILKEKTHGGISTFMKKLLTSHSMYMNKKYDRTGSLMCRPFRSKYIDSDSYFRWLVSYIHLNPIAKLQPGYEEDGIQNMKTATTFLKQYKYSSYMDYFIESRPAAVVLNTHALPIEILDIESIKQMLKEKRTLTMS